ncbi:hypothetical protein PPERSA_12468 [Pseudocohnilembus persalinus]|uniref:Transmembrane protein n=1 Tax=Pseudocohnilembus persalinus TaxID=266149 RepID=A0A0V0QPW2_PSEPJ|nr:hypothetical protein PPERSA_12468 [Pseudocohnilembus persalinus]|eukprot:KRX04021.1 hypothetical protein PPERSA_12468 [Pseudocohnilembus persalinus]
MDVFGQHVFLNMGQKGTYKTTLGGYSTMILGIVFTWFCISQILRFVYNKTIYFTTDQSYDNDFDILKLTNEWEKQINTLKIENFLCPPIDYEIQLQGQYNQDFFKYTKIEATKCDINEIQNTNNWFPQRCATQSEMEDYYNSEGQDLQIAVLLLKFCTKPWDR